MGSENAKQDSLKYGAPWGSKTYVRKELRIVCNQQFIIQGSARRGSYVGAWDIDAIRPDHLNSFRAITWQVRLPVLINSLKRRVPKPIQVVATTESESRLDSRGFLYNRSYAEPSSKWVIAARVMVFPELQESGYRTIIELRPGEESGDYNVSLEIKWSWMYFRQLNAPLWPYLIRQFNIPLCRLARIMGWTLD